MTNSLREAMTSALEEQKIKPTDEMVLDSEDDDVIDPVETTEADSKSSADEGTKSVERDANGKFNKAKQTQADSKIPDAQKQESTPAPEQGTTGGAPATFSKEEQAQWENVPPLVKNAIQRLNTQSQTAVLQAKQELADTKRENAARDAVLEPYAKLWQSNGVPVQQGLATAMKAVYEFERDPKGTLQRLAAQYGISLAEDGNDQFADPVLTELNQLKQQLNQFQQGQTQAQQNAIQQRNMEEATRFTETKDVQGNLAHPHWERVMPQMVALLPAVRQMNPQLGTQEAFKRAYDIACQQNPDVAAEIAATQSASKEQQEFEKRRDAALKARQGVVSPAPASAIGGEGIRKGQSIRDTLKSALQEGLGRV